MTRTPWWGVIWMSCALAWTGCAGHPTKPYERHVQASYDERGRALPGYATLNIEFLDALQEDLNACYKDKLP